MAIVKSAKEVSSWSLVEMAFANDELSMVLFADTSRVLLEVGLQETKRM